MPDISPESPVKTEKSRLQQLLDRIKASSNNIQGRNKDEPKVHFDKTLLVQSRLKYDRFFEEPTQENRYGMWQGRRIIGRDVPINKGVYLGGSEREAIVVDDETMPVLSEIYQEVQTLIEERGGNYKTNALRAVFDIATKRIKFIGEDGVKDIANELNIWPDKKVGLKVYIKRGGVCRHQNLLCAYLLERLCKDGHLGGKVSVDRNFVEGQGGHAWCRYTSRNGTVFILDVTQEYIGKLDDLTGNELRWFYERPEDKIRQNQLSLR